MARPKKSKEGGELREPFQVRLTKSEKQTLEAAARIKGWPMSSWIRVMCLELAHGTIRDATK